MIIGVTGFSWSGSSAVKELLNEFADTSLYNPELTFAYHPDGLSDLDYHLNENCAKFMSSGVAIPRFKKVMSTLLHDDTKGKIKDLTEQYIASLVQAEWIGSESGQVVLYPNQWIYEKIIARFMRRVLFRLPYSFLLRHPIIPVSRKQFSIKPERFIEKTQDYTDKILESLGLNLNKTVILDQPFPGNSPLKSMRYFKNSKAIIVDRDPRDIYMFVHVLFPNKSLSVPHANIKDFIAYYYNMHKTLDECIGNKNVLYLKFEDLIYNYNVIVNQIIKFTGLTAHERRLKYFNPQMSMANTRVFEKIIGYEKEIKCIEEELHDYLYDFSKYQLNRQMEIFDINPLTNRN